MNLRFIPVAIAQGLDASAQPTFGPINITGGTNGGNTVQVLLSTSSTTTAVGGRFKVDVELKTGTDITVSEYQIVLKYDPLALTVIDQDPNSAGTQSQLLDTLFAVNTPVSENNFASQTSGLIFLKASGTFPVTINRKILEIEFQSQKLGNTEIQVDVTPIDGTRIRRSNTDIPYTNSSLNIQVNQTGVPNSCTQNSDCATGEQCLSNNTCGTTQPIACTDTAPCPTGQSCVSGFCVAPPPPPPPPAVGCTTDTQCGTGSFCFGGQCVVSLPVTPPTGPLPRTGLGDDLAAGFTIFAAIILIGFGLFLRREKDARN